MTDLPVQTFELAVILTAVHDRHVCDFNSYRTFLSWMVGDIVWLWDIGAARRVVAAHLVEAYPQLADHPPPEKTDSGNANRYVKSVAKKINAEQLMVMRLPEGAFHTRTMSKALGY